MGNRNTFSSGCLHKKERGGFSHHAERLRLSCLTSLQPDGWKFLTQSIINVEVAGKQRHVASFKVLRQRRRATSQVQAHVREDGGTHACHSRSARPCLTAGLLGTEAGPGSEIRWVWKEREEEDELDHRAGAADSNRGLLSIPHTHTQRDEVQSSFPAD